MKLVQIVFSPTGGTQKAADLIAEAWKETVTRIDLTDAGRNEETDIDKDDIALIAVPSYGGRVPQPAAERLAKIKGNQARCILVCVYGNRAYEDTLVELQDIAESCGFQITAAIAAVAEHSIMHQYASGRPDQEDAAQLHKFAKTIFDKITEHKLQETAPEIPGNRPYRKPGGAGLVPKAAKNCTECGFCAQNCPVQAISRADLKTADSQKCISCMRCVVKCPESARKVNRAMVSAAALAMKKVCSERKENELFC